VYGEVYRHSEDGVDQNSAFTIRFASEVTANVTCSQNVGGGVGFDYIEVMGTKGRIKSEWPSNIINVVSETVEEYRHPTLIVPPEPRAYVEKMYRDELDAWVQSVNQRTDPPITVDDGVNVLEVISAVFESGRSNSPVTLR
jgi:predicted dehydrogenase